MLAVGDGNEDRSVMRLDRLVQDPDAVMRLEHADDPAHHDDGSVLVGLGVAAAVWTPEPGFLTLADPPGTVVERTPVLSGTLSGEELRYAQAGKVCKRRVLLNDSLLVLLDTCAPTLEPDMDRFLGSLHETSP